MATRSEAATGTDPFFYEGGLVVNGRCGVRVVGLGGGFERSSSFYRLLGGRTRRMGVSLRRRNLSTGRQAAKGSGAPAGAKGWLRVSMCQIACASPAGGVAVCELRAALAA